MQILKSTIFFGLLLSVLLILNTGLIQAKSYQQVINEVGSQTGLPNFSGQDSHPDAPRDPGLRNIASSLLNVVDFMKYLLGSIAVFMIILSGGRLITAADQIDDQITKQKSILLYSSIGLIMVIVADEVVYDMIYGQGSTSGQTFSTIDTAKQFAIEGAKNIQGFYNFLSFFGAAVGVFVMIYNAILLIVESTEQDTLATRKKHILYAFAGLVLIGLSELYVKEIIFPGYGYEQINTTLAISTIGKLINFVASFIAFLSIGAVVYAGYLYVTAQGEDDQIGAAKKMIFGAVLGILLAAVAFALVSTVIPLEGRENSELEITF